MATKEVSIYVPEIEKGRVSLVVVGTRPLICNRMSQKAWHDLLLPGRKKNQAERQSTLKHNPLREYQASPYLLRNEDAPTLIAFPASAFKGALSTAALDLPGTKKAQIGRLVYVEGNLLPIWGIPELFMAVTRSADINHTPDIRTRAILPRWAARLTVSFVRPLLNEQAIVNLLSAAGTSVGIGDWRPEKGKGDYGQFAICNEGDPRVADLMQQGRAEQKAAWGDPQPYDDESAEMLTWWYGEVGRRGFDLNTEMPDIDSVMELEEEEAVSA